MIATVLATALIGTVALAATGLDAYRLLASGPQAAVLGPLDCPGGLERIPPAAGSTLWSCGHGDVAPPGVDVTKPRGTAELVARDGAADSAIDAAEAAGVPTPEALQAAATTGSRNVTCDGDGTSGYRVQAMYAYDPAKAAGSAGGDRYAAFKASIQTWAAGVDTVYNRSAALTGGYRKIRWVTEPDGAGGCVPSVVKVPVPGTALANGSLTPTRDALVAAGYNANTRKYAVWADATALCGIASVYSQGNLGGRYSTPAQDNWNNGYAASHARIDTGCWGLGDSVEAHEISHMLGAVLNTAPNATAYGHCTDGADRMCYEDGAGTVMRSVCPPDTEALLDCNGNDYFSTYPGPGTFLDQNWNSANSRFLLGGGNGATGGTAGTNRVAVLGNDGAAGLPTQVSAAVTIPEGRTHTTAWSTRTGACALTAEIDQATVRCSPSVAEAAVTAAVTDSEGVVSTGSVRLVFDQAARPSTLVLSSQGSATCLPASPSLAARLTDTATGAGVYGAQVQFVQDGALVAQATTDASGVARATPTIDAPGMVTAVVVDPMYSGATRTGVVTVTDECPPTGVTGALSATSIRHGDPVSASGTVTGVRGGVPDQAVAVTVGGSTTTVRTDSSGVWTASFTGVTAGGPASAAVAGLPPASLGTLTVAPWQTTLATSSVSVDAGSAAVLTGRLYAYDPATGRTTATGPTALTVTGGGWTGTATTAADGTFAVETQPLSEATRFTITSPASAALAGATATVLAGIRGTGTPGSALALTGPQSVWSGASATLSGTLTVTGADGTASRPSGQEVAVTWSRAGRDAVSVVPVVTDADGSFSLVLDDVTADVTAYAAFAGSDAGPATTSATVTVTATPITYATTTAITAIPSSVLYGTTPTVTGTLAVAASTGDTVGAAGSRVRVVYTPSGLSPVTAYATVASTGTWSLRLPAQTRATTVAAYFDGTDLWPASSSGYARTIAVASYTALPAVSSSTTALTGAGTATVTGTAYKTYGTTKMLMPGARVSVVHHDAYGRARSVGTVTADAYGRFTVRGTVHFTGTLRTSIASAAGVRAATAPARSITVRAKPAMAASTRSTYYKRSVTFYLSTSPVRSSKTVYLQRYHGGRWATVSSVTTGTTGKASRAYTQTIRGTVAYRWYFPGDRYNTTGYSANLWVSVR
jgi:hypothetical protein